MNHSRTVNKSIAPGHIFLALSRTAVLFTLHCLISIVSAATQPNLQPSAPSSTTSDPPIAMVALELKTLKERQDLLVDSAQRDLARMQFAFGAVAAIATLFAIFTAIRQVLEQRRRDRLEDLQLAEAKGVMTSFKDNITTINALIGSLKSAYDYQSQISQSLDDLNSRIKVVDDFKNTEEIRFRSEVDALNNRATTIFIDCQLNKHDRDSFKHEQNRLALASMASDLKTLERIRSVEGLISPIALFLRALSRFNSMEYSEAAIDLAASRDTARPQLDTPLSQYAKWDSDEIKSNLRTIIDEVPYHLGIIQYNLGQFELAGNNFSIAHQRNTLDFRSRIYIPELMFFDDKSDPRRTEEEYKIVEAEIIGVTSEARKQMTPPNPTWEAHLASLKLRQGNFYLKKPLSSPERKLKWGSFENPTEAAKCYWESYDRLRGATFTKFSLAQALQDIGRSAEWRDTIPEKLFREVFYQFRNDAILKTEPILLSTLYLCAAISCFHSRLPGESPTTYLVQCRQNLQRVPKNIRIFSPLTKVNLPRNLLLDEISQIESLWQTKLEGAQR